MYSLTATEVAILMVAAQQGVLAAGWIAGAALVPDARSACRHWAAYAALSAISLVLIVASASPGYEGLRAAGNLAVVASLVILQHGLWAFAGRPPRWAGHMALGAVTLVTSTIGMDAAHLGLRVAVLSGVLALLLFWSARDMRAAACRHIGARWGSVLALPLALAGVAFTVRAGRALADPTMVVMLVSDDNALNVGAAAGYLVLGLAFQLTLVLLVVARLVDRLERASRFDELTGLMNRRATEEALQIEIGRAHRLSAPLTVLMLDADHFKRINDGAGHAAGDLALRHLGALLLHQLRDIDRAGRWGGEEFLVLLPGTGRPEALQIAERLRQRAQLAPPRWDGRDLPLTLSIGVAEWRGRGDSPTALLTRADAALYRAKSGGRNRVEVDVGAIAAAA